MMMNTRKPPKIPDGAQRAPRLWQMQRPMQDTMQGYNQMPSQDTLEGGNTNSMSKSYVKTKTNGAHYIFPAA